MKRRFWVGLFLAGVFEAGTLSAENVAVRHAEGLVRGFLLLRSLDGSLLASGDLIQTSLGERVTSRVIFRFQDGSIQDETAVFSEKGQFRLLSDHLVQRGPIFPRPLDVAIDAVSGRVTVRYQEEGGVGKLLDEQMALPSDLSNGLLLTLLKNIAPEVASTTVSMVFATPKPRLVKVLITRMGQEAFSVGGASHRADRFDLKIQIGGLAGLIAPLIGKQPQDTSVWILGGEAPGFVKSEGPMYQGGPVWRIELASPVWPR